MIGWLYYHPSPSSHAKVHHMNLLLLNTIITTDEQPRMRFIIAWLPKEFPIEKRIDHIIR
jgi:hypothetical protein